MKGKRSKSLAEELQEFAFAAPSTEDYLDGELEGAPLALDDDLQLETLQTKHPDGDASHKRLYLMKGSLELEGEAYDGKGISREQIFEQDAASNSVLSADDRSERLSEEEAGESMADAEAPAETEDFYEAYGRLQSDVGISDLKARAQRDREKGMAVQRDRRHWDACLELRILLQKPLTFSHQLPPEPHRSNLPSSHLASSQSCEEFCEGILQNLFELEDIRLSKRRQEMTEIQERSEVGDADEWWKIMEENYKALKAFSDVTLDRFHRQSMLQSGATTAKGNLQRLHQGISSQVQSLMQMPNKVLLKSRMPSTDQPRVLGVPSSKASLDSSNAKEQDVNAEMFIDTEFYEALLNEYLLGKGTALPASTKKRKKRSRQGDSQKKMKQLFTEVQEKLVNFMTPSETDAPVFAKHLFQNLFDQRH